LHPNTQVVLVHHFSTLHILSSFATLGNDEPQKRRRFMFSGLMSDESQEDGIVAHRVWSCDLQGSTNEEMTFSHPILLPVSKISHVWRANLRES
jgi:hypothetical protein